MHSSRAYPLKRRAVGPLLAAALWLVIGAPPAGAATILVRAGGDVQAALNAAHGGDFIVLEAGTTFVGNFVLPARPDRGVVTIRTSASDPRLPGESVRVSPDAAPLLPKVQSPNGEPALRTAPGAHGWRIVLVEFLGNQGGSGEIVRLGDGTSAQSSLSAVPQDLVIDRCYLHAAAGAPQKRGIALNSGTTTIENSWIGEIKAAGQDSQAIAGWNGPGPYSILNNYLQAAGQGFMLGGSDAAIRGLVPANVTFAGNFVTRPPQWRGSSWQVKNLLELKNARSVWIEGNVFENNWRAAQPGYAILFTPRNQDGGAPWSTVEDVHFRYNVVRHVAAGVNILGRDSPNASGTCRGVELTDNLFYDVDGGRWGGNGEFLLLGDGPQDVVVEHNTVLQSGNILSAYGGDAARPVPIPGFVFRENVVRHNDYGVHGNDRGVGNDTLSAYFPSAVFSRNIIGGGSASLYPSDNTFVSPSAFDRLFADAAGNDYRIVGAGQQARGGDTPAGAEWDRLSRAWRAAESGSGVDKAWLQKERDRVRTPRGKGRGERE